MITNQVLRVCVTDYRVRLVTVKSPDRDGTFEHVLLGFENAESYQEAGQRRLRNHRHRRPVWTQRCATFLR